MKWGKMGLHYGLLVNMEGSHSSQGLIWAHDPNNQGWVIIPSHACEFLSTRGNCFLACLTCGKRFSFTFET